MAAKYTDGTRREKDVNNGTIVDWVKTYLGDGPFYCLILDGPESHTSKAFCKARISDATKIYAPQYDEADAKKMEKNKRCRVIRSTLSQAICKRITPRISSQFSVFYLDFMGSPFGRKHGDRPGGVKLPPVYPMNDLVDCLKRTRVKKAIVAITVSGRMGSKIKKTHKYANRKTWGEMLDKDFFRPIIASNQFAVIESEHHDYSRTFYRNGKEETGMKMRFFIYYIRRDLTIDTTEVDFAISPFNEKKNGKELLWGFNPELEDSWGFRC